MGQWSNLGERRGVGGQKRGVMGHWSQSVGQRERVWVAGVRLWGESGSMGNCSEIMGR